MINVKDVVARVKADESKLARYSRAFLAWLGGLAIQVASDPNQVVNWTLKRWVVGLAIAALPGLVGLISVGQKNPAVPSAAP
jgi:Na+/proline symporter